MPTAHKNKWNKRSTNVKMPPVMLPTLNSKCNKRSTAIKFGLALRALRCYASTTRMLYYHIMLLGVNAVMSGAIKKVRAKHPHSIMISQNSYVANPINLYNRLKNCGFLCYSRNYCGSYVREGELITKLGELCTIVK